MDNFTYVLVLSARPCSRVCAISIMGQNDIPSPDCLNFFSVTVTEMCESALHKKESEKPVSKKKQRSRNDATKECYAHSCIMMQFYCSTTRITISALLVLLIVVHNALKGGNRSRDYATPNIRLGQQVDGEDYRQDMPPNCIELYFEQQMDHFGPSPGTFLQRYFMSDKYYTRGRGGPMFFYLGNEADVTLYVNNTGLIWENAKEFGALVVFAEHRYYGKSQLPLDDENLATINNLRYLSSDQALMDYVTLIQNLKQEFEFNYSDAVVGFGGSYGGMLASWGRIKYPHVWDGVIAASAPILPFQGIVSNASFAPDFFAEGLIYDISRKGGVRNDFCETNLRKVFGRERALLDVDDPALMRNKFKICDDDNTSDKDLGTRIANWINDALSYMAMGNFPYKSSYILNGDGVLPPFPVRAACDFLQEDLTSADKLEDWLVGLASFGGVYYNYSKALQCNMLSAPVNNESSIVDMLWDYQYCSELFMIGGQGPDQYDTYWDEAWDGDATARRCRDKYGFWPNRYHIALTYGSPSDWARTASNIVWSQGEYDPWRGGGVVASLSDSLITIQIPEAAHHLDLFFSHPNDTEAVISARSREVAEIRKWIEDKANIETEELFEDNMIEKK